MREKKISDQKLLKEFESGKTLNEIAGEYGYSEKSITTLSKRLGKIKPYKHRKKVKLSGEGSVRRISIPIPLLRSAEIDPEEELYYKREPWCCIKKLSKNGMISLKISEERGEGYAKMNKINGSDVRTIAIPVSLLREVDVNPKKELYAERWARKDRVILKVTEGET